MDMRDGRLVFSECKSGAQRHVLYGAGGHTSCLQACIATAFILNFSGNGDTREDEIFPGVYWGFSTLFYWLK